MAFSPYLAIRAVGNTGLVQPGRVVNGNNFLPIGNPFSGLESISLSATISKSSSRKIVQFGDDLFCYQQDKIRKYNTSTGDWDIVLTVALQESVDAYEQHTGLYHMHDSSGAPILIALATRITTNGVIRVIYDGTTWSSALITTAFNFGTPCRGQAVYQNKLYCHKVGALVVEYDPTTDLVTQLSAVSGTINTSWSDMIVYNNRLFLATQGNTGDIHELVGGNFVVRITDAFPGNDSNPPAFFEKDGNLYVLYGSTVANQGWELARVNIDPFSLTNLTDAVLPNTLKQGSTTNPAVFYNTAARNHVILDQDSDPENPRILLLFNTNTSDPVYGAITVWEFIDETQQLVDCGASNLTGEMHFPHNTFGSGAYHWTSGELNVHIVGTQAVQDGEEISFVAFGDPGIPDKKVRIYFSNEQQVAKTPATFIAAGPPTTGVMVGTDTFGDFVDGVDADGSTVYTVTRDIIADNALVGSRQVLMPYIERS